MQSLLSIEHLSVAVGPKLLVNDVSFQVPAGKIVAIAGGSGSGKTTIGLCVLRLLPDALKITGGRIIFGGQDLLGFSPEEIRRYRGRRIGMVFQEPLSAFDPLFTIGQQLDEVLEAHTSLSKPERYTKALQTLAQVELPDVQRAYRSFPHQLSGGMRQRAMIAQAIVGNPALIIADEPTSNLDVTLQAKIMELFRCLKNDVSIVLIAHDLGMINRVADEVVVLQQGRVVEQGLVSQVLEKPEHLYTQQLVMAAK